VTGKTAVPGPFFTVPWLDTMVSRFNPPPCDPMAKLELDQLIEKNSKEQGVKPDLIREVINQESGNRPCAVSSKGAQGLMQLMPETAAELGVGDPFNAKQNVEGGTKLLKTLLAKYKGDVALTLAAYNAGSGRVDRDGGIPDIPETMGYVTQILARLPKW
jgi:soluble lytic murein transglycosylase-like protein